MKNKKTIWIIAIVLIVLCGGFVTYRYLTKEDAKTSLTIIEKQWIDKNKNEVIDISIINDIPIFNYEGEGLILDYLTSLEENTGLSFNKLAHSLGSEAKSEYVFTLKDEVEKGDILIYEDSYVLITKNKVKFINMEDINLEIIGVYKDDFEKTSKYMGNTKASFRSYTSYADMFEDLDEGTLNGLVVPRIAYLEEIVDSDDINIAYNVTELHKHLVLTLGKIDKLNDILTKYYNNWDRNNFDKSFTQHFTSNYFSFLNIDETEKVKFKSKRYIYGYIENLPYDYTSKNKLMGINNEILKNYSTISETEITYKRYRSMQDLVNAFNKNEVDFFFGINTDTEYAMDVYKTIPTMESEIVLVSKLDNNTKINSLLSIDGTVATVKSTKAEKSLGSSDLNIKTANDTKALIANRNKVDYLVMDKAAYDYYAHSELLKYKIDYQYDLNDDYGFVIRDIKDNIAFAQFLDYYLSYTNVSVSKNVVTKELLETNDNQNIIISLIGILVIIIALIVMYLIKRAFSDKKTIVISRNDKIKYIDMLTSLKNRTYLNDNIEKWDDSEIYPQTVIIVDLNNVAYINDNYGHEEGDNVIKEAANILVKNQISGTEIMRTNGNEFLIYVVGYDEKQIVAYTRKLSKEFKELAHGFGAAIGYSMINDAIKTIDDAVNEATLDMRNNKEELNN